MAFAFATSKTRMNSRNQLRCEGHQGVFDGLRFWRRAFTVRRPSSAENQFSSVFLSETANSSSSAPNSSLETPKKLINGATFSPLAVFSSSSLCFDKSSHAHRYLCRE